ncbi:MAG: hypothetical protein B7733_25800 [Myxococcales bacterium FL481]|nr:MAG: hypothetical protein B7733_25800 [Myxococcales bacterium FL481]
MNTLLILTSLGHLVVAPANPTDRESTHSASNLDTPAETSPPDDDEAPTTDVRNPFTASGEQAASASDEQTTATTDRETPLDSPADTSSPTATPPAAPAQINSGSSSSQASVRKKTWPQRPVRYRLDVALHGASVWVQDSAHNAFHHQSQRLMPQLAIRGDRPVSGDRLFVGATLSYRASSTTGFLVDESTELRLREPMAGARASFRLFDGLDVYGQLAAGPSIVDIVVGYGSVVIAEEDRPPGALHGTQRQVALTADGQAGLTLYLPKKWMPRKGSSRVSIGFDLAGGYQFRNAVAVDPQVDGSSDDIEIEATNFGDIAVRGAMVSFGLFGRFQ